MNTQRPRRSRFTSPTSRPRTFLRVQARSQNRSLPTPARTHRGVSSLFKGFELRAQIGPSVEKALILGDEKKLEEEARKEALKAEGILARIKAKKLAAREARLLLNAAALFLGEIRDLVEKGEDISAALWFILLAHFQGQNPKVAR